MRPLFTSLLLVVFCAFSFRSGANGINGGANPEKADTPPLHGTSLSIIYVAPNATGAGTSWSDPSGDLPAILNNAAFGTEIWVKEGVYYPTTCSSCDFAERNTAFNIPDGVQLLGGFAGTETAIDQRNIAVHPTILSGDIDRDGTLDNNAYSVVMTSHVSELTVVDGFTITAGNAADSTFSLGSAQNSGAGWYNDGASTGVGSNPVIRNCRFENNHAWGFGGAVYNNGSFSGQVNPIFENCLFSQNSATRGGGAIFNTSIFDGFCGPQFYDCVFQNNASELADGGAVFNIASENGMCDPLFQRCDFIGNQAGHDGGAIFSFGKYGTSNLTLADCYFENNSGKEGGAIYNDGSFDGLCNPLITNCHFTGNTTFNGDGGAIYNSGFMGICNPTLIGCFFENNISAFAGGVLFNNGVEGTCNPVITNCQFMANEALTYGGSIYNQGRNGQASPMITNCVFAENQALSAGAIYNLGTEQGEANATITNCTFYKNNADVGGAIYANAGEDSSGVSSPSIVNSIFWENTANEIGDVFRVIKATPTISYSLVDKPNCAELYTGNGGSLTCGEGMIFDSLPDFIDAPGSDFHLSSVSVAKDAGNNDAINQTGISVDLDNLPRIVNGTVDLGAFEFEIMPDNSISIIQQPISQEVCAGSGVALSVSATGSPPLSYQWFKNGNAVVGAVQNTLMLPTSDVLDSGNYYCEITNNEGTSVTSDTAAVTVHPLLDISILINAVQDSICEGEPLVLIANQTNGGVNPAFQWFLNGDMVGENTPNLTLVNVSDGDWFSCEMVTSAACTTQPVAYSDTVTIHVENWATPSLFIAPDETMPCEGQTVTFSATPNNGGLSPSFQWFLNGIPAGSDEPIFELTPQQDDEVICQLTSSRMCVDTAMVNSAAYTVDVTPLATPAIAITPSIDTTICAGTEVAFYSTIEHGGDTPVFSWLINGVPTGNTDAIYSTTLLEDGDTIACQLYSSIDCVMENPVISNEVVVAVDSCSANAATELSPVTELRVYPNPTDGRIFIEMSGISSNFTLRLLNAQGQTLMSSYENLPMKSLVKLEKDLTDFPQGIYYFQIITDNTITTKRIVVF